MNLVLVHRELGSDHFQELVITTVEELALYPLLEKLTNQLVAKHTYI